MAHKIFLYILGREKLIRDVYEQIVDAHRVMPGTLVG
jgi:hypothetical protein